MDPLWLAPWALVERASPAIPAAGSATNGGRKPYARARAVARSRFLGPAAGVFSMARSRWSLGASKSDKLLAGPNWSLSVTFVLVSSRFRRYGPPRWFPMANLPPVKTQRITAVVRRASAPALHDRQSEKMGVDHG